MTEKDHFYIAIDLKSFYASVECMERGLNPLTTNLVVADTGRTEKTICLAVSPSLKAYRIPGRARLFEVVQRLKEVNLERKKKAPNQTFTGASNDSVELEASPELEIAYIAATPRMSLYMSCSTRIYQIYLKYVAPEDIHVYSIDEVFIDVTAYLQTYQMSARELAVKMINEVFENTGITATAGVGTNLYLCKIAMDIVAKHMEPDKNGVRIAEINEISYRKMLWSHKPLTDFWRVGRGYAKRLEEVGIYTMGDIARCSIGKAGDFYNEELLYKIFGINAELLIDHAWGYEPCTLNEIKSYKPETNSISTGQVLQEPYSYEKTKLIVREMTDLLVLDLVDKELVTDQIVLTVGYDTINLQVPEIRKKYRGAVTKDGYGREIPKHAHGSINLQGYTSSTQKIIDAVMQLFCEIVNPILFSRRVYVVANHIVPEDSVKKEEFEQLNLFTDYNELDKKKQEEQENLEKEKRVQKAVIDIKKKFGGNAILKGMNFEEGATTRDRNKQIGGHKA